MARAGFDVTVIAPSSPEGPIDGVSFVNVPSATGGRLRRTIFDSAHLLRVLIRHRADVYQFHDPQLLPIGLFLRCLGRCVVYDVYENVRDDVRTKPYLPKLARPVLSAIASGLEWLVGRTASRVITATPSLATQFPPAKTTVVHNYPIIDELDADFTLDEYLARRPHGVYVGAMTVMRQAREMFAASDDVHGRRPDFALVTAGPTFGIENPGSHPGVQHRCTVPREDVPSLLSAARFGISLLADEPHLSVSLPTKVYEYAAAGLPVIVSASTVAIRGDVESVRCGLIVDETDTAAIADAMVWLLDHPREAYEMGQRGASLVRDRYQWSNEAEALVRVYRQLEQGRRR